MHEWIAPRTSTRCGGFSNPLPDSSSGSCSEPAPGARCATSDVDVGILIDGTDEIETRLRVELERALDRPVDLVRLDTAPPRLRFEIAKTGILLVEREPRAWPTFRARAMIDWWDWAPTAGLVHATMMRRLPEEAGRGQP